MGHPAYETSLDPLPSDIRDGMVAMGLLGVVSSGSTFCLLAFITYRMAYWRLYYERPIHSNQIFVLIYNLLLADFQQALSFLISFYWISQNKLVGPNTVCFAQGWLVQIGDMSSGLWVLAIAVHTFVSLVRQRTVSTRVFVCCVIGLWVFALFLTTIGPILGDENFFVPSGAWCWINQDHDLERLYLHYLWIFVSQLGSLCIYTFIFFYLRARLTSSRSLQESIAHSSSGFSSASHNEPVHKHGGVTITTVTTTHDAFAVSRARIMRTARYMVVYPFAYVALTLPLAAARVSSMAGRNVPNVFLPIAGTLMASCGIVDVLLYILTRKALVKSSVGAKRSRTPETGVRLARRDNSSGGRGDVKVQDEEEEGIMNGADMAGISPQQNTIMVSKSVEHHHEDLKSVNLRADSLDEITRVGHSEESLSTMSIGGNRSREPKSWLS